MPVTIFRDAYGIPHLYADTTAALFFGFGYIQAKDRLEALIQDVLRLAKIESLLDLADFGGLISRLATAEEQLSELKKWRDESDRRRWQTQLLFFGSLLTLAIQLTVLFLKK